MRVWVGADGGQDRLIVLTNGWRFYLSTRWFGYRVRVYSVRPYLWVGKA